MKHGISQFVTVVLILAALISATTMIGHYTKKEIEKMNFFFGFRRGMQIMKEIRTAVLQVSGEGGSRVLSIDMPEGEITFSAGDNNIYFSIPAGYDVMPPSYKKEEDGLIVASGSDVSVFINGSSSIVENNALMVSFSNIGNETSPQSIDTSKIINYIMFKKTGKKIHPPLHVFINGKDESIGTGYSYPVVIGPNLNLGRIVAKISSTDYNYTVIYTLPSGSDYIDVKIRDIKKNS